MKHHTLIRRIISILLLAGLATGVVLLLGTEQGRQIRHNPQSLGEDVRQWVNVHPVTAPALFIGLYMLLSFVAMPVWWVQMLSGYGFGLAWGIGWSMIGAIAGATLIVTLTRFLTMDYLDHQAGPRMAKLHAMQAKLGHNGLLVVMATRLAHILPFGLSNYLFGVTRITPIDTALGTLLGGGPAIAFYVTLGAHPRLLETRQWWIWVIGINCVLLLPLAVRYLKPQWFKQIGVE